MSYNFEYITVEVQHTLSVEDFPPNLSMDEIKELAIKMIDEKSPLIDQIWYYTYTTEDGEVEDF